MFSLRMYLIAGLLAALLLGVWYYGHQQFLSGVTVTKMETLNAINKSEGLKNDQAKAARDAARLAAQRVCEQAQLPTDACDEF